MSEKSQKFRRGDHVQVAPEVTGWSIGTDGATTDIVRTPEAPEAIVWGSYRDQYGGSDERPVYTLLWPHGGCSSWHDESVLTLIRHGSEDDIRAVLAEKEARETHERDMAWIGRNWPTIRLNLSAATCEELMRRVGISNPWGSQGERAAWHANMLQTFVALDPILSATPDDPAAAIAHVRLAPIDVRIG